MSTKQMPLGQVSQYPEQYDPSLLFPVPRAPKREEIGLSPEQPGFVGQDVWNAWEVSWLLPSGKPVVVIAEIRVPALSPFLIESKSLKLYLNSWNQHVSPDAEVVGKTIATDLSNAAGAEVEVRLVGLNEAQAAFAVQHDDAICIDDLPVEIDQYQPQGNLLAVNNDQANETLVSHLLKSNCPVTGQPDWGSLYVRYRGSKIDREALLRYVISFRQHTDFHEQCVERAFADLAAIGQFDSLTVWARYVRRGGLDINPWRSTDKAEAENGRHVRQ
ncbi:NADPH-dependent 7-cyano-7-deazaguanine reductase QueF [Salinibius halmophilus]|uniref:NADPH-dependent 7-cyano-7-deazaguanine reductase QueF n=1 Tax=Salinibius halmophilus TaxID=1853216 RepID=UPI000E66FDAE|nr:NADPH-dependent 7-cyano-7-deazaguanine reductase QueF [Salinibius halmophilus]